MPIGTSLAPYLALQEGIRVGGKIVDFRVQQKTNFDTGRPQFFERDSTGKITKSDNAYGLDGRPNEPICDWIFTVDTGVESPEGDTERRIFLDPRKGARGSEVEGRRGQDAVEKALKKVQAHRVGLEIGGSIWFTRGPKVKPYPGGSGPACVTYEAEYQPPDGGVGAGTPVDDVPWLVGGERFIKAPAMTTAPVISITSSATAPTTEMTLNAQGELRPRGDHQASLRASVDRRLGGAGSETTNMREDDTPPF